MKKSILLNEDEKNRILNLHETAKNLYENKKPVSSIKEDKTKKEDMKKVIKLTESDLEKIVRRVIEEQYMGVAFGGEQNGLKIKKVEATEQTIPQQSKPSNPQEVVRKAMAIFPDFRWYGSVMNQENVNVNDPNAVKAFNIARTYLDKKIPQLNLNQGADFFDYMKQQGNGNVMKAIMNGIAFTKSVQDILIPALQSSDYPNSKKFEYAIEQAQRTNKNQNFTKSLSVPTYKNTANTIYSDLTGIV